MHKEITFMLTCCNRVDLLRKTLDSFFALNTYPIKRYIAHNDGDDRLFNSIRRQYPQIEWEFSGKRIGYSASLDRLLTKVDTEYIWSTEDDWFYYKNPGFIEKSLRILERFPDDVHQVWIRDVADHNHPQSNAYYLFDDLMVHDVIPGYRKIWNGFSLNPGLRRMSDWKKWFPNGLSEYGDEAILAQRTAQFNYKAVSLFESSIKHIGWDRRSINFKP